MGPDLTDKRWIVAKGILFAFLAVLAGVLQLFGDSPLWQKSLLLVICVWASCRFYYFLFYCLQAYVDPKLRSAGVMDLLIRLWRLRRLANLPMRHAIEDDAKRHGPETDNSH
jgi:hypothetical protein